MTTAPHTSTHNAIIKDMKIHLKLIVLQDMATHLLQSIRSVSHLASLLTHLAAPVVSVRGGPGAPHARRCIYPQR